MKSSQKIRTFCTVAVVFLAGVLTAAAPISCLLMPAARPPEGTFFALISNSRDAGDFLLEQIQAKRIVFLAENHTTVNPISFLARHIRDFYDAGVRYLFHEGGLDIESPGSPNYGFVMFYPWVTAAWKYEWIFLHEAIAAINNSVADDEKIRVIFPEEGFVEFDVGNHPELIPDQLNGRDAHAAAAIISIMDQADPEDKAIVFYGANHGSKTIWRGLKPYHYCEPFDWKTLGCFLAGHYGNEFASFDFHYLDDFPVLSFTSAELEALNGMQKAFLPADVKKMLPFPDEELSRYDAYLAEMNPVFGVYYQYIPRDENLRVIFGRLNYFENDPQTIRQIAGNAPDQYYYSKMFYLESIYYLKLYFGDQFDYDFWNPKKTLKEVLNELAAGIFGKGSSPSRSIQIGIKSIKQLREYHGCLAYLDQEDFDWLKSNGGLPGFIERFRNAVALFPEDLWSSYWLSFASMKNEDWTEALAVWERILADPLSRCMENLPDMYRKAAECAEALGQDSKASDYRQTAGALVNEHGIDTAGGI